MKLETFFEKFELFAEAPNGVQKLRELILQLAVQGKLMPQDPSDEPVSVLLDKIKFEKEQLIKEGKIKGEKLLLPIEKNEIKFKIPHRWQWVRLKDILLKLTDGTHNSPPNTEKGDYKYITAKNIKSGKIDLTNITYVSSEIHNIIYSRCNPEFGDILYIKDGATTGIVAINDLSEPFSMLSSVALLKLPTKIYNRYLFYILTSPYFYSLIRDGMSGVAITRVTLSKLNKTLIPLTSFEEQHRIVAKVDQLMSLCDELEERQQKKRETRVLLNNVAISQLLTARETDTFAKHWQRICNNFDLLYSVPENISKLRQAILQLAVMGKLVSQDPNDEPASVLLDKIRLEKDKLVNEKKISKIKQLSPIKYSDLPYKVPKNWYWVKLGEITKLIEYGTSEKATELGDVPVFRMNNIQNGKIIFDNLKFVSAEIRDLPRLYLQYGDLLFNRTNSYELVGKTGVFQGESHQYTFASYLIRISVLLNYVSPHFINLAMNSVYFRQTQIEPEITQQCGQANFNGTKLMNAAIPLPPLHEQKRIVTKVNQLMDICDNLETKLARSQDDREKLMDVAVRQLLSL